MPDASSTLEPVTPPESSADSAPQPPVAHPDAAESLKKSGPIDIVRYRWPYALISLAMVIPALVFMGLNMAELPQHTPVKPGIDFVGGTLLEYGFSQPLKQQDAGRIAKAFSQAGIKDPIVQIQAPVLTPEGKTTGPDAVASVVSVRISRLPDEQLAAVETQLRQQQGSFQLLQKNSIGPTLAAELLKNGLLALGLAYLLIVGYLTYRFQWDFALAALVALAHDTVIVFGLFAALGYLYGVEVNSLFITAILTVVGFSVHDTIVVFDRLRENTRLLYSKKLPFAEIANISVNQTLARSINTSLTALLALLALWFLGGSTLRDFVLALIVGITVGTYSSICVASLWLTWWRSLQRSGEATTTTV